MDAAVPASQEVIVGQITFLFLLGALSLLTLTALGHAQSPAGLAMPRRWPLGETMKERKTQRTLHTDEEVKFARANAKQHDWAQRTLHQSVGYAERYANLSDEVLWELVFPTTVPRRHYVNQLKGCPVHGAKIKERDAFHPWRYDPIHKPWKMICPVSGEEYPSNDFGAYLASGMVDGPDRSGLTGEHPDDGYGWKAPDGEEYYFIAEYAERVFLEWIRPGATALARAYLLTGDRRYAHKAAILLYRIAEEYKRMAEDLNVRARCDCGYPRHLPREPLTRPNGNGWVGFYTDRIWENESVNVFATAYDDIFDAIDSDKELLEFLRTRGRGTASADEYKRFFEDNFLRVVAQGILDQAILGNDGMHQLAMMNIALVLNYERCKELVDWVYTGAGQMKYHLANYFFKDGSAYESLGGYNSIHVAGLNEVAERMERLRALRPGLYPVGQYPQLTRQAKHKLLFDFPIEIVCTDRYYPSIGDTGSIPSTARANLRWTADDVSRAQYDEAFRLYHDPRYAKVLHGEKGDIPHPNVFAPALDEEIKGIIEKEGKSIARESGLLDGYGLATLRSGNSRALWMFYGHPRGHAHDDLLDIGLYAYGMSLMEHLGYPRSWHYAGRWEQNWLTHFKVGIVGGGSAMKGTARLLKDLGAVKLVEAYGDPYREDRKNPARRYTRTQDTVYRRACLLIDLDEVNSYVVDVYRVRGGTDHYWSFHGWPTPATPFGLAKMEPQEGGTLAGPKVAYGEAGPAGTPPAFSFLDKVQRGKPERSWGLDWAAGENEATHLRFTQVMPAEGKPGSEVILATGRSPSGGPPYEMQWALSHTHGEAPLATQFISIIEPYQREPLLRGFTKLSVSGGDALVFPPAAFRLDSAGRTDTVVVSADATIEHVVEGGLRFRGEYGVFTEARGEFHSLTLVNGTHLARGEVAVEAAAASLTGVIVAVDRVRNRITVEGLTSSPTAKDQIASSALVHEHLVISNDARSVCYRIEAVEPGEAGTVVLRLNADPKIGEGNATGFRDGVIESQVTFPLANQRYYHGARVVNEIGTQEYRVASVTDGNVYLDPHAPPEATADALKAAFREGANGLRGFRLYDYGAGDAVTVAGAVALEQIRPHVYRLRTNLPVTLTLPSGPTGERWFRTASGKWERLPTPRRSKGLAFDPERGEAEGTLRFHLEPSQLQRGCTTIVVGRPPNPDL